MQDGTPMSSHTRMFILASLTSVGLVTHAQLSQTTLPAPPPTTKAAVGQWDAGIVQRAAKILASPAQWNRADTGKCPANAKTFSISCALQEAVEEAAGLPRDRSPAAPGTNQLPARSDCRLYSAETGQAGSCGPLFEEVPILTLSRVNAITSGIWRKDVHPNRVWAGTMTDAEYPVMYEAPSVVEFISGKKYAEPLIGYNNDSTTTFANVQAFFLALQDRLIKQGRSDLDKSSDAVEIEIYADGTGVIRTYAGWFPVSGFVARDSMLGFQMDTAQEIPPNGLDREILQHAAAILTTDSVWNRADNRQCTTTATTWSIYCAEERASIEVTGGFHHRRPALELVRQIVDERSQGKSYSHRLMGYNNDPSTRLEDVQSLFAEAIARIK
jgi:hypothetical protein